MRLHRESYAHKTYFVEPLFKRRQEAKNAVVYLSVSRGIEAHVHRVAASIEERLSPEMRRKASEEILPEILSALRVLMPKASLDFVHDYTDGGKNNNFIFSATGY